MIPQPDFVTVVYLDKVRAFRRMGHFSLSMTCHSSLRSHNSHLSLFRSASPVDAKPANEEEVRGPTTVLSTQLPVLQTPFYLYRHNVSIHCTHNWSNFAGKAILWRLSAIILDNRAWIFEFLFPTTSFHFYPNGGHAQP